MNKRLFAIGDIHGCYDPLHRLIEGELKIRQSDRIIFLGDYIDRGPMSREVIDYILDLTGKGFDVIPLIGNHESMLLDSVSNERNLSGWFMNGGYETLYSFGVESADELEKRYLDFFPTYFGAFLF